MTFAVSPATTVTEVACDSIRSQGLGVGVLDGLEVIKGIHQVLAGSDAGLRELDLIAFWLACGIEGNGARQPASMCRHQQRDSRGRSRRTGSYGSGERSRVVAQRQLHGAGASGRDDQVLGEQIGIATTGRLDVPTTVGRDLRCVASRLYRLQHESAASARAFDDGVSVRASGLGGDQTHAQGRHIVACLHSWAASRDPARTLPVVLRTILHVGMDGNGRSRLQRKMQLRQVLVHADANVGAKWLLPGLRHGPQTIHARGQLNIKRAAVGTQLRGYGQGISRRILHLQSDALSREKAADHAGHGIKGHALHGEIGLNLLPGADPDGTCRSEIGHAGIVQSRPATARFLWLGKHGIRPAYLGPG